jgi:hypothetical protein
MFKGMTKKELTQLIDERVTLVGPITRVVLEMEAKFKAHVEKIEWEVSKFYEVTDKFSAVEVPKKAKNYVAPFVDNNSVVPYLYANGPTVPYSIRFLSDYIAVLVGQECINNDRRKILEQHGFIFQIEEAVVRYGLMEQSRRPAQSNNSWIVDNWSFYKNPHRKNKTLRSHDKIKFEDTGITRCLRTVYFDSQYLRRSVDMLDKETLYVGTKHNCALYDCMYINKELKTVFMFNATGQQPRLHPLSPNTVKDVMSHMRIAENDYKINFFYCCSSTLKITQGCEDVDGLAIYIAIIDIFKCANENMRL